VSLVLDAAKAYLRPKHQENYPQIPANGCGVLETCKGTKALQMP
jgi:hypothetical protein